MQTNQKYFLCCTITLVAVVSVFFLPPISQDPAFHAFADQRTLLGIPNFWNVISNLPFLFIAIVGFLSLKRNNNPIFIISLVLITGIMLTGLGSAWYHLNPNNTTLVWDRIPMTIVFMSLFSFVISDRIGEKTGNRLFLPLLFTGIFSVLYWEHTETLGRGDLRLYGLVQFYPMLMIPLLMVLFKGARTITREMVWVMICYVLAKASEHFDKNIFEFTGFMSGHAIKHLFAAAATWFIVKALRK